MTEITRHFLTLAGGRQVHYRRAGEGPPVMLLHQSPTSSRELDPLIRRLAEEGFTAIAPDTPGFGLSEPHERGLAVSIEDLADNLALVMDALGIRKAGVYGFHTGGATATAFGDRHPARAACTITGGISIRTDAERAALLRDYLPPFVPVADGTHLAWLWSRVKDQSIFFPWYRHDETARMPRAAYDTQQAHAVCMDFLMAGDNYRGAYGAAFRYNAVEALPRIRTPHYLVSYESDPLHANLPRLPTLPANVEVVARATPALAIEAVVEILKRHPADTPAPTPPAPAARPDALVGDYVRLSGGHLRIRRADGSGRPAVLLHDAAGSGRILAPLGTALARSRPVIVPDLPGRGDSDDMAGERPEVADEALILAEALDALGTGPVDLFGQWGGASVALELSLARPDLVNRLVLADVLYFEPAFCDALLANYAPPIELDFYGGHLMMCWHIMRDQGLFWPWYDRRAERRVPTRIEPDMVHGRVVDMLKAGNRYRDSYHAHFRYRLADAVPRATARILFAAPGWDPNWEDTRRAAEALSRPFAELPPAQADWAPVLANWFDG